MVLSSIYTVVPGPVLRVISAERNVIVANAAVPSLRNHHRQRNTAGDDYIARRASTIMPCREVLLW